MAHTSVIQNQVKSSQVKDKPKMFYSYMKQLQTGKVQVAQLEKEDRTMTESDKEAADELYKFFKSVLIDDKEQTPSETKIWKPEATASVSPTFMFQSRFITEETKGSALTQISWYGRCASYVAKRMCRCISRNTVNDFSAIL